MATNTTIIGRVGTDPALTKSPSGKDLAHFRLAETIWNSQSREEETRWYDVSAWDEQALAAKQNVTVGMRVYVTGNPSVYNGTNGERHQINAREIGIADRVRYEPVEEDDIIPF